MNEVLLYCAESSFQERHGTDLKAYELQRVEAQVLWVYDGYYVLWAVAFFEGL